MPTLKIAGQQLETADDESVLDTLLRNGIEIPHACRSGVCGACTVLCTSGELPAEAQDGLREVEREQGLFLACQCRPTGDLELSRVSDNDALTPARVVDHVWLSDNIARLRIVPDQPMPFIAGQYLAVQRDDGLTRSYSIASLPSDGFIELHVRRVANGRMSNWLCDSAEPGTKLALMRPRGSACYPSGELDTPLLLIGVGCGLSPVWGVLRDALDHQHRGPITLVHAGASPASLYLRDDMRALARAHPNLHVRTIVSQGAADDPEPLEQGSVLDLAGQLIEQSPDPAAWLCFVGGDQQIVKNLRLQIFLAGVASARILADPFVVTPPQSGLVGCSAA